MHNCIVLTFRTYGHEHKCLFCFKSFNLAVYGIQFSLWIYDSRHKFRKKKKINERTMFAVPLKPKTKLSLSKASSLVEKGKAAGLPENMGFFETAHFEGYDDKWKAVVEAYENGYSRKVLVDAWNTVLAQVFLIIINIILKLPNFCLL